MEVAEIQWKEPPKARGGGAGNSLLSEQVIQTLRANPGKWALVAQHVSQANAPRWKQQYEDIEFVTRDREKSTTGSIKCNVYARARAQRQQ